MTPPHALVDMNIYALTVARFSMSASSKCHTVVREVTSRECIYHQLPPKLRNIRRKNREEEELHAFLIMKRMDAWEL